MYILKSPTRRTPVAPEEAQIAIIFHDKRAFTRVFVILGRTEG